MTPTTLPRSESPNGLAYHRSGAGPAVLLLHGVGLRAESWALQIAEFSRDYRVYAVDLPGHGESARLEKAAPSLADYSARIAGLIEMVIGTPVFLAGHSMGALIALDLAERRPELCRAAAALNAIYRRSPESRQAVLERARLLAEGSGEDLALAPLRRWFGQDPKGDTLEAARRCEDWLRKADREGYAAAYGVFAGEDGPSDAALAGLAMPALFLTGSEDGNSTAAMSQAMASCVPRGKAVVIAGAGHMAQMTHAAEVTAALRGLFGAAAEPSPLTTSGALGGA